MSLCLFSICSQRLIVIIRNMVFSFLFKGKGKNQERAVVQQYWGAGAMDPPRMRHFTLKTSMPPASLTWGDSNEPSQETEHRVPGWTNAHGKHWRFSGLDVTQQPALSNHPQLPKDRAAAGGNNVLELNQQTWPEDQAVNPNPQAETIKNNPDNLEEMTISENKADSEQQSHSRKSESGNANGAHRLPPESVLVKPFDGFKSFDALLPSIDTSAKTSSENLKSVGSGSGKVVAEKPTCSLSIICYSRGCSIGQVTVTLRDKFKSRDDFAIVLAKTPKLITDDEQFFERLRYEYFRRMCGFWRRNFSLKTLRRLRLLSVCGLESSTLMVQSQLTKWFCSTLRTLDQPQYPWTT